MDKLKQYALDKFFESFKEEKLTKDFIMRLTVGSLQEAIQRLTYICDTELSTKINRHLTGEEITYMRKLITKCYDNDTWK